MTKQIISNGTVLTKRCFYLKSIITPARRSRPSYRAAFYMLNTKKLLILHVECRMNKVIGTWGYNYNCLIGASVFTASFVVRETAGFSNGEGAEECNAR